MLTAVKAERIGSVVVVLTMHNDGERAAQALRAGASAFLLKESAGESWSPPFTRRCKAEST